MNVTRRQFVKSAAAGAALTAVPASLWASSGDSGDPGRRPNIVFCLTDDQGYGDVGYMSHPRLKTPHLDAMAAAGLRMNHFYTGAANCSPTRATCRTGRHHRRCGVPDHSKPINPEEVTIAHALAANGYATGHFGKWHLGKVDAESPNNPAKMGFQEYFSTINNAQKVNPSGYHGNRPKVANQTIEGEDSKIIMDRALGFMARAKEAGKPFLVYIWFHTPHVPHGSTPEFLGQYRDIEDLKTRAYYAQLTAMDAQMGRLRKQLRAWGVARDTLVVFTSDNGPNRPGSTGGLPGGKGKVTPGGCRVPGLVEWPAVITKPVVSDVPMVTTDLYPTFLAAAGIESYGPERTFDGENMLPLLKTGTHHRRNPIRYRHRGNASVSVDGKWGSADADPGYEAWAKSVDEEFVAAQKRLAEFGLAPDPDGKRPRQPTPRPRTWTRSLEAQGRLLPGRAEDSGVPRAGLAPPSIPCVSSPATRPGGHRRTWPRPFPA